MRFSIKTVRQGTQIVVFKHKFLSRVSANTGETAAGRSYREGHSRAHQHRVDARSPRLQTAFDVCSIACGTSIRATPWRLTEIP